MPSRAALLMGALWLGAVASATTVGIVAVGQVGQQVGDPTVAPLTSKAIQQALQSSAPRSASPALPLEPTDDAGEDGTLKTVSTTAGVVSGRCHDGRPRLLLASPADGYQTERSSSSGATVVRFVGARNQVVVTLTCTGQELQVTQRAVPNTSAPRTPAPSRPTPGPEPTASEPAHGSPEPETESSSDH